MKEKRGSQHLEIIISFILFIGVGLAGLDYISPFSVPSDSDTTLNYVFNNIIDNSSINIETYTVILDNSILKEDNRKSITINLGKQIQDKAISRVKRADGIVLRSTITKKDTGEIIFDWTNNDGKIIYIGLTEDFTSNPAINNEQVTEAGTYNIASLVSEKVISEKRINALASEYKTNYESLLNYFNIPKGKNFGFKITEESIDAERGITKGANVFVKNERKEILLTSTEENAYKSVDMKIW